MPINFNPIIVFDFETTSKFHYKAEITEIAARAYDARTFQPFDNSDFCSLVKPLTSLDKLDKEAEDALQLTGIKKEELENAPDAKIVWQQFVAYVNRFNKKKDEWNSPIPAGSNVEGYDLPIADRYNEMFGPKKKDTILFNTFKKIDLMKILLFWFEGNNELKNFKQETLREYFGWSSEGTHRAMSDVEFEAALIFRFMNFHRNVSAKTSFKNCFKK